MFNDYAPTNRQSSVTYLADKVLKRREKGAFSSAFVKILCSRLVTHRAETACGPLGTAASL